MTSKAMIILAALGGAAVVAIAPVGAGAAAAAAAPAAATDPAAAAAACNVQHGPWYTRAGYRHVALINECGSNKTVCIAIPYRPAWFPIPRYTVPFYQEIDVAYAPTSINEGNRVYYC
ncbi:hypothetical protein [Nonomuraea typhae]|uniref:Secreted protein n=1 Tax=Nonomuraea typhae TaxID=2603600 RepID=A0ABW7Z964_9ACTN